MASELFSKYYVKLWEAAKEICAMHPEYNDSFVITPGSSSQMEDRHFRSVLHSIDLLDVEFNIVQKGYSFVYQYDKKKSDLEWPVFHVVSGKKLK